jgi:hypothetical protein
MRFEELLARADDEALQQLLGAPIVRLLNLLDPSLARPTKSLVLFSQMIGRATRGPRAGGNAEAQIVTVVDTALPGFGRISDAFQNWEDVW